MIKEQNKSVIVITILVTTLFNLCIGLSITLNKEQTFVKVSFPEEMCLAKEGDILLVERVSDSIYLGYVHNR